MITKSTQKQYYAAWLDTPLGPMIAIADENVLYLLEFVDRRGLEREVLRLRQKMHAGIIPGHTEVIDSITEELKHYFSGKLQSFKTPLHLLGSPFQQRLWHALQAIPLAKLVPTLICREMHHLSCCSQRQRRANQIAIVIPCHRVINTTIERIEVSLGWFVR